MTIYIQDLDSRLISRHSRLMENHFIHWCYCVNDIFIDFTDNLQSKLLKHYWLLVATDVLDMDAVEAISALETYEDCNIDVLSNSCPLLTVFNTIQS